MHLQLQAETDFLPIGGVHHGAHVAAVVRHGVRGHAVERLVVRPDVVGGVALHGAHHHGELREARARRRRGAAHLADDLALQVHGEEDVGLALLERVVEAGERALEARAQRRVHHRAVAPIGRGQAHGDRDELLPLAVTQHYAPDSCHREGRDDPD